MKVGVKCPHSDPCVAFVSCLFEFRLFLSSVSPCRARRRVPQRLCVWWMKLGHFFFWPCFAYRQEDQYSAIQNGGWRLKVSLPLSTPFPLTRGWTSFWLMSLSFTVLTMCFAALPDTSLDTFGQRRISLWCVLFHAMFVVLSVYAQAPSVFCSLLIVFL